MNKTIKNSVIFKLVLLAVYAIFSLLFFVSPLVGISNLQLYIEVAEIEPLYGTFIASWAIYLINSLVCLFATFAFGYTLFGKKLKDKADNVAIHLCVLPLINVIFDCIMSFVLSSGLELPVSGLAVASMIFSVLAVDAFECARFLKTDAKINYFLVIGGFLSAFISTVMLLSNYESGDSYAGMQVASFAIYIVFLFVIAAYYGSKIYALFADKNTTNNVEKEEIKAEKNNEIAVEKQAENITMNEDPVAKLKELKSLLDEGVITQEIYDEKSKKYIEKL